MKRKISIFINIASLCLCIGALVVGVISAKTVTASLSGSIGFKAYNCNVDFTGTITGAVLATASTNKVDSQPTLYIHPTGEPTSSNTNTTINVDGDSQTTNSSVKFGNIAFAVDSSSLAPYDIIMTFNITNKSEFAICASINIDDMNLDTSISCYADNYMVKIAKDGSATIKLTLNVKSPTTIENDNDSSKINFEFKKFDSLPTASSLNYSGGANTSSKTFTVSSVPAKGSSSTLTIPGYVVDASGNLLRVRLERVTDAYGDRATITNLDSYTKIILSDGVEVGNYAFYQNSSITSIVTPKHLYTGWGRYAAYGTGITSIEYNATDCSYAMFGDCASLTTVTLKANTMEVYNSPFGNCSALTTVIIEGEVKNGSYRTVVGGALVFDDNNTTNFGGCTSITTFYVKKGQTPCAYITANCTKQADDSNYAGYDKYTRSAS